MFHVVYVFVYMVLSEFTKSEKTQTNIVNGLYVDWLVCGVNIEPRVKYVP